MFWLTILVVCTVGAMLPGLGSEVLLVGAATTLGPVAAAVMVVVATIAHVAGKLIVYAGAAAGAPRLASHRLSSRWQLRMDRSKRAATTVVFTSALASLPPLWVATIASGAGGLGPVRFGSAVFAGRLIRYSALVAGPQLVLEVLR
ncbi:MAG TPA: hypothetical protein VMM79_16795 [Longimicrobiales bacterium]|nr:hypothetical protein [Longimicrobiales bacterium]